MLIKILETVKNEQMQIPITTECGKTFILNNDTEFLSYAINILLVLKGKRSAYKIGIGGNNDKRINQYYATLSTTVDKRLTVYNPYYFER